MKCLLVVATITITSTLTLIQTAITGCACVRYYFYFHRCLLFLGEFVLRAYTLLAEHELVV